MKIAYADPLATLLHGNCLDVLHIVATSLFRYTALMPDSKGRFQPGEHWRKRKLFWDRDWLVREYVDKQRTAMEIAMEFEVTENSILFWLKKHGIRTRTMRETRKLKKWGSSGERNPQFGRRGPLNARWKGGKASRPQGRVEYRRWRTSAITRYGRICAICQRSNLQGKSLHVHHLVSWRDYPQFRFDEWNALTVCSSCHPRLHPREKTILGRFAKKGGEE